MFVHVLNLFSCVLNVLLPLNPNICSHCATCYVGNLWQKMGNTITFKIHSHSSVKWRLSVAKQFWVLLQSRKKIKERCVSFCLSLYSHPVTFVSDVYTHICKWWFVFLCINMYLDEIGPNMKRTCLFQWFFLTSTTVALVQFLDVCAALTFEQH